MTMAQVEFSLALTRTTARQLRQLAQTYGVTDAAVVEQALALLFERDDGALRQDYWLSVASMQEDWQPASRLPVAVPANSMGSRPFHWCSSTGVEVSLK